MTTFSIRCSFAIVLIRVFSLNPASGVLVTNPTEVATSLTQTAFVINEQHFFFTDDNDFYVRDVVTRFDGADATFISPAPRLGRPHSLALLDGELLVADYGTDEIRRLTFDGEPAGVFATTLNPVHLESDSIGSVYTTSGFLSNTTFGGNTPNHIATRFDSSGAVTGLFMDDDLFNLGGIDADALGNVYVAQRVGTSAAGLATELFKFAPDGTLIGKSDFPGLRVADISIDESGERLFAGSTISGGGLHVFDISGVLPTLLQTLPVQPFVYQSGLIEEVELTGVYFDPSSRHVFATDGLAARAHEYDENLNAIGVFENRVSGDLQLDIVTLPIPTPSSLSLLAIGAVLSACWMRRR